MKKKRKRTSICHCQTQPKPSYHLHNLNHTPLELSYIQRCLTQSPSLGTHSLASSETCTQSLLLLLTRLRLVSFHIQRTSSLTNYFNEVAINQEGKHVLLVPLSQTLLCPSPHRRCSYPISATSTANLCNPNIYHLLKSTFKKVNYPCNPIANFVVWFMLPLSLTFDYAVALSCDANNQ